MQNFFLFHKIKGYPKECNMLSVLKNLKITKFHPLLVENMRELGKERYFARKGDKAK